MFTPVLEKFEEKINNAVQLIEFLRLQVDELEEKNSKLSADNLALKNRQVHWEQTLATLLGKLENVHLSLEKESIQKEAFA